MKNLLTSILFITATTFTLAQNAKRPNLADNGLSYSLNSVMAPLSVSKSILEDANTLMDLNCNFNPSWVKEYISVEIINIHKGVMQKAKSENATLTEEQKKQMNSADVTEEISINIQYIPENNLSKNDPKEMNFSFLVNPEIKASYPGGKEAMNQYLKTQTVDKIANTNKIGDHIGIVKFTVTTDGSISNIHLSEPSRDESIDQILLDAISNMSKWTPASYSDGTKIAQEFAFMVGNLESCAVNLANISRD